MARTRGLGADEDGIVPEGEAIVPCAVAQGRLALRPAEAARALGVSDRTLRKWMRDEGLPYARVAGVVLIPRAQLEKWMAERIGADNRTDQLVSEILDDLKKSD